jgi:phospholipid/cholesterol/gamma-HCH transport system ATP-binding protein
LDDLSENLIEIHDLKYSRGPRVIFEGMNLKIKHGEITALMGPSGTGKTTLLRLITRQLIPQHGTILVDGVDISTLSVAELYQMRQRFGMLFQNGALLTDLSVFENVAFPLREHTKLTNRLIRHVVLTKLHAVGLRGAADMMPSQLSGGMARRVALARAMVMDPDILIYDEPFVGLDPISMGVRGDIYRSGPEFPDFRGQGCGLRQPGRIAAGAVGPCAAVHARHGGWPGRFSFRRARLRRTTTRT